MKQIRQILWPLYLKLFLLKKTDNCHKRLLSGIRERGYARVVFFASNLSMWRYQGIYDLMRQDPRFKTLILLVPFNNYSDSQKTENINALRDFFNSKNIPFEDTTDWPKEKFALKEWFNPDILFYPQPYERYYGNLLDSVYYRDRLLCFAPYGVGTVATVWSVNTPFQNLAWRLFYETDIYREVAQKITYNKGRNVVVVGNTNADIFLESNHSNPWKEQSGLKKRIIWAPHFSIKSDMKLHRSSFLWLHDMMVNIAQQYSDTLQFAFKPHPKLKTELYKMDDWGKERTDEYYRTWATMPNTQLEESSFIDLFMTSDAMIHDCASFTVEYHYSKKPCLFTTNDIQETREPLNELGRAALDAHYFGKDAQDICRFLDEVVLKGADPKKDEREAFFRKYLLPPNGKTAAGNILDNIVESIWG